MIGRIAFAQIDPVIGAFDANVKKIKEAYQRACREQARLLLTPELGVCGYLPLDLIERPEIFERNEKALAELAEVTRGQRCALAVGHVGKNPSDRGRGALNLVSILEDGKITLSQAKTLLPTYDVFDEARYFEPAREIRPWNCDGHLVGVGICEDFWGDDPTLGRRIYDVDPVECHQKAQVDLLISISASPYVLGKHSRREALHAEIAKKVGCPLIYVNQVGANDEILFDGGSFAVDAKGKLTGRLSFFSTAFGVVDVEEDGQVKWVASASEGREDQSPDDMEILSRALVTGIREYFSRTGFKMAILGLSGGIDSAVVATLAAKALGAKNVLGVAMPSQYSSSHSLEDAERLAKNLGTGFEVRPIKFMYSTMSRELSENRGQLAQVAQENLQARLRGLVLMTLSNHYSALVLTTGNKSEVATGYCTLYGDMVGALAPIGDVFKTRVYELARYLNQKWGNPIPERCLTKAPSAELRPNQTDQDSLPPYELLDAVLEDYLEKTLPVREIEARHAKAMKKEGWIQDVLRMLEVNEYKRRQAAPVLKISNKAFGIGRRVPIAKVWDHRAKKP